MKLSVSVLAFCLSILFVTNANAQQQCKPQVGDEAKICVNDKVCVCNKRPPAGQGQGSTWNETPTSSGICTSHGQPFTTCSTAVVKANVACTYFKNHRDLPKDPPQCPTGCKDGGVTLGSAKFDQATQCCKNKKTRACTPIPQPTGGDTNMDIDTGYESIDPICSDL